jgi:two-component system C4-dicarboxylate transport sensor histidine kinase DctB
MEKTGGILEIATQKTDDSLEVSFRETGVGISKKTMKHLFTPFFITKALGMGMDMGLSISRKFVESNGGFIEVKKVKEQHSQ